MITHKASGHSEPSITIEGRELSLAEAMSLRVAVGSLRISLHDPGFRAGLGPIADAYDKHLERIEGLMLQGFRPRRAE